MIAKDRAAGAQYAVTRGAKAIIMDDGFQNPHVAKKLSLVVIDGEYGFGNGRMLPAGPLREPASAGIRRADAVIVINQSQNLPVIPASKPVLLAKTEPKDAPAMRGKRVIAFCGIAHPQKFFDMLAALGAVLPEALSFPDHYAYTDADIKKLAATARQHQAPLVTTPKDAVRLPKMFRDKVTAIDIGLAFENPAALDFLLDYALTQ